MGGLGALIVIAIYLAIAIAMVRSLKTKQVRYAAIALFVLLPTADAIIGRVYLQQICANEGGLKVNRVARHVRGFMDTPGEYLIKKYGYEFVEGNLRDDGSVDRISVVNGKTSVEIKVPPRSLYRVRSTNTPADAIFLRYQYVVEEIQSNAILGSSTQILFRGGWAERLLGGFSDAGAGAVAWCPDIPPEVRREQVVASTLVPN